MSNFQLSAKPYNMEVENLLHLIQTFPNSILTIPLTGNRAETIELLALRISNVLKACGLNPELKLSMPLDVALQRANAAGIHIPIKPLNGLTASTATELLDVIRGPALLATEIKDNTDFMKNLFGPYVRRYHDESHSENRYKYIYFASCENAPIMGLHNLLNSTLGSNLFTASSRIVDGTQFTFTISILESGIKELKNHPNLAQVREIMINPTNACKEKHEHGELELLKPELAAKITKTCQRPTSQQLTSYPVATLEVKNKLVLGN